MLSGRLLQSSHGVLQDDGLELWRSALKYAATPSEPIMALAPLSVKLLTAGTDILPRVLRIIDSYIVLQPEAYLAVSFVDPILWPACADT